MDAIELKVNGLPLKYSTYDGVIINRNTPRENGQSLMSAISFIFDLEDELDALIRLIEMYQMYASIKGAGSFDVQAAANLYQYIAEGIVELDNLGREILRDAIAAVQS